MSDHAGALALAGAQVAAVRDDPAARLALMAQVFRGPTGRAPRHLPFRRAALSFMRWQARRGVLNPLDASPPGSVWWRAVNERLLRDGCETVALLGGLAGEPSSQAVRLWLEFGASPTGRNWYRAHNASIVAGYLEHRNLAEAEGAPERFFMNVALVRVLYAHALAAAPRLALGRFAPLGRLLGDPRLGMAGVFLSLRRVLPNRYPLALDVERYIADEQRLGRMLDYAVIVPRLQRLYEWSAEELGEPRLLELVRDGNPIYAWPFEQRHVWRTPKHAVRRPGTRTRHKGSLKQVADTPLEPDVRLLCRSAAGHDQRGDLVRGLQIGQVRPAGRLREVALGSASASSALRRTLSGTSSSPHATIAGIAISCRRLAALRPLAPSVLWASTRWRARCDSFRGPTRAADRSPVPPVRPGRRATTGPRAGCTPPAGRRSRLRRLRPRARPLRRCRSPRRARDRR